MLDSVRAVFGIFLASQVNPWQPERVLVLGDETGGPPLDEETIRTFLSTEYPRLVGAIALIAGSRSVAEEAVQEALARAWERGERGEEFVSLRAWVGAVALNLSQNGWRRALVERRARRRVIAPAPVDPAEVTPELVDLRRALDALPERQREMVVLHYYLDLSVDEVGRALRVHPGTVKTSLFRARRTLAEALGERDVEEAEEQPDRA